MSKGYAGLRKHRASSAKAEVSLQEKVSGWQSHREVAHPVVLHLVETDRKRQIRVDSIYDLDVPISECKYYTAFKRLLDVVGAAVVLVLLSPLLAVIVVGITMSGGKLIFKHRRVGKGGVFFDCLKFRTMVPKANQVLQEVLNNDAAKRAEWLKYHKLKDDPRVTRLGRFLRRTSLDELPQLWNVLMGEMSLVGPRPVVPEELRKYGNKARVFLSVVPGVTGLWQVSGRNNTDYRRRVALDVRYVRSRTIILDLYILFRTIPAVFARDGAY